MKKREKTNVKMKKKQIAMLIFIAIIAVLLVVSFQTPGTITEENYQCATYATIWALLPPVIAIGLALVTKEVYTSLLAGIITGALECGDSRFSGYAGHPGISFEPGRRLRCLR